LGQRLFYFRYKLIFPFFFHIHKGHKFTFSQRQHLVQWLSSCHNRRNITNKERNLIMLFVWIALSLIAILFLFMDTRSLSMRWVSGVAFTGGLGALSAVLDDSLIPYVQSTLPNQTVITALGYLQAFCSISSYYGLPFAFAMLALQYHPVFQHTRFHKAMPILLSLPPLACLLFTPGYSEEYPIAFPIVSLWAVPYIAIGSILIASKQEKLPAMRRTHLFTCLALLPPVICYGILNFVMASLGFYGMWIYNAWSLAVAVPFLVFIVFKYGFLGMRLLIERRKMDSTLRAITSGTAILNHAIKNDVGKMRLFSEKMKHYAEETNQPELIEDLAVILTASEHIRDMIGRVHEQTQEIPLIPSVVPLSEMLQGILSQLKPYLGSIHVQLSVPDSLALLCDEAQVTETLTNVLMNAADAMPQGGALTLKTFITKKSLVLEVKDSGIGMDKQVLKQALEPFYTTKKSSHLNYGLGLAYCYNVMKKHGGSLELSSEKGKGTSVFLSFPFGRIQPKPENMEVDYGANKIAYR
jgi:signal transduction histidine kinase